jgi:K+-transporting ATPase ATPase C chain
MSTIVTKSSKKPAPVAMPLSDNGALRGSIGLVVITLAGAGFLYSLAGVGLGEALFPDTASGSLIEREGQIVGSALVAQPFTSDAYFSSRPSAAGYNPMAAAGSNQARTNPDMRARVEEARATVAQREGIAPAAVPGDLITQSGGGLDPHISPESAAIQIDRVARARGLDRGVVAGLVQEYTEAKQLGFFGAPRVNVLELNLALDVFTRPAPEAADGIQ